MYLQYNNVHSHFLLSETKQLYSCQCDKDPPFSPQKDWKLSSLHIEHTIIGDWELYDDNNNGALSANADLADFSPPQISGNAAAASRFES